MYKENIEHLYNGVLLSYLKDIMNFAHKCMELTNFIVRKSRPKRHVQYDFTYKSIWKYATCSG